MESLAKKLLKATIKSSWPSTMNLLLVCAGVRNAYYNDDDIPFTEFSCRYQRAFLDLAILSNIGIQFEESGRWLLYNRKIHSPRANTHANLGKLLQFPCSSGAMDISKDTSQKVGVEFRIHTEFHETTVTQFFCFKRELPNITRWFYSMRKGLLYLKGLSIFHTFQPLLIVETYEGKEFTPKEIRRIFMKL